VDYEDTLAALLGFIGRTVVVWVMPAGPSRDSVFVLSFKGVLRRALESDATGLRLSGLDPDDEQIVFAVEPRPDGENLSYLILSRDAFLGASPYGEGLLIDRGGFGIAIVPESDIPEV
jgi:hypothetical protein